MRQINVPVSDEAHAAAKAAAANSRLLLRLWVERAVIKQAATESHDRKHAAQKREGK